MKTEEMQLVDGEIDATLRTLEEHLTRLEELSMPLNKTNHRQWSRDYGVNSPSILSSLGNFDVTKQMPHDPMHIILEGIFPLEFSLCVSSQVHLGYYSYDDVKNFFVNLRYHPMDKKISHSGRACVHSYKSVK
jgi:hypothetical protein